MHKLFALFFIAVVSTSSSAEQNLLVFGDSLSAGYGLPKQKAWPSLLEARLKDSGFSYTVVNASISGETTAGGRNRLEAALRQHQPRIVIIQLGANDGLRGLPISNLQNNLTAMIETAQKSGAKVLLIGMRIPPNYGHNYTASFAASFAKLANQHHTGLVPFLFEGIAGKPEAFLPDGLHPNAESQPLLLNNVWKQLKPMLSPA